jgi:uncharacterized protein (DUF1330 family)
MIFITQLIYIREEQEKQFNQFEDIAIPVISKYNGKLMLRIRPNQDEVIGNPADIPYEIHIIRFENKEDYNDFLNDDERKKYLYLKEQSIKSSMIIKGIQIT